MATRKKNNMAACEAILLNLLWASSSRVREGVYWFDEVCMDNVSACNYKATRDIED